LDAVVAVVIGGVFEWYWALVIVIFGMICVWMGATARASIKQRNEARAALKQIGNEYKAKLDDAAQTLAIREKLGLLLSKGQEIRGKCANEKIPPPEDEANEWASEVEEFLVRELDRSYVSRFRSDAGVPFAANSISSVPHRNLWAGVHTRLFQLERFIEQLCD